MQVLNEVKSGGLFAAVVVARGVALGKSSDTLKDTLDQLVDERKNQDFPPPATKDAVRNLLKSGGFKPSGRNKPASEYLAQAAREGRFPLINNLVDINNYVSLNSGLPISLLDAAAVGDTLKLRYGRAGERYVFNASGQEIELAGLICACAGDSDTPLGNAVKDSIAGKIKETTTNVVGIIYAPDTEAIAKLARMQLKIFAHLLQTEGKADSVTEFLNP